MFLPNSEQCRLDTWICSDLGWGTLHLIPFRSVDSLLLSSTLQEVDDEHRGVQLLLHYPPTGTQKQYDSLLLNKLLNVIWKV